MPYLLLAIGVALGLYGLYKFFLSANPAQVSALLKALLFFILGAALLFMAVTGRLPAAIALLMAMWPLGLSYWKSRRHAYAATADKMTPAEALEVLGLTGPADPDTIEEAYKRLMMKVHPDQQGSDWMAAKLNEARDLLLRG